MRGGIRIVVRECPRCGRRVAGTDRPLYGSAAGHAAHAGLCDGCATAAERDAIAADIEGGVRRLCGGPDRREAD